MSASENDYMALMFGHIDMAEYIRRCSQRDSFLQDWEAAKPKVISNQFDASVIYGTGGKDCGTGEDYRKIWTEGNTDFVMYCDPLFPVRDRIVTWEEALKKK